MKLGNLMRAAWIAISVLTLHAHASAQFLDDFNGATIRKDPTGITGWSFFAGDGSARVDFRQGEGHGSILVDATSDRRNIWWALIKREVGSVLNLNRLAIPGHELRIEARIRISHAPRRVNLHLNTQKTTDFHTHLMEFDIPDSIHWHTISMTTRDFEAEPGDKVFGQLALMDWGASKYRVDVDYFKVDVVDVAAAGPDKGEQVPYHPPIPDLKTFDHEVKVAQDSMIDLQFTEVNLNDWHVMEGGKKTRIMTVSGNQFVIMRWDLSRLGGKRIASHGVLELTTHTVQRSSVDLREFGKVRIVEILDGEPHWDQKDVTYESLVRGQPLEEVLNSQMIIDVNVSEGRESKTLMTISRPVLQRMMDGKTLGLAIRPLGAINVSFYAMEEQSGELSARLRFTLEQ